MTQRKITFAPGCFDKFEGTQEELEAFINEITEFLNSVDLDDLADGAVILDESSIEDQINEMFDDETDEIMDPIYAKRSDGRTLH